MKKNTKIFLSILVLLVFVVATWSGQGAIFNRATNTQEIANTTTEDGIVANSDVSVSSNYYVEPLTDANALAIASDTPAVFATSTEDGQVGTAMPETIDTASTETDYYIESLEQFNSFQAQSQSNTFAGLTIHLAANIELEGDFAGIGSAEYPFAGTFDGHGYSITKLSSTTNGLFVAVEGATIQNLAIGNAKVSLTEAASNVGILAGTANGATVENVVIASSKITSDAVETSAIGGMFGKVSGAVTVSNSDVKRLIIKTAGMTSAMGGFVGQADAAVTMIASDIANSYVRSTYASTTEYVTYLGGVVGYATATVSATDVNAAAMNVQVASPVNGMGTIAGHLTGEASSFERCSVNVTTLAATTNENYNIGGFVGYVDSASSFANSYVTNAKVNARDNASAVGGFIGCVGTTDAATSMTSCLVNNATISGKTWVGEVIGKNESANATVNAVYYYDITASRADDAEVYACASIVEATAETIASGEIAWNLNTVNGTIANSMVWSQGNGPRFATEAAKATVRVAFTQPSGITYRYTNGKGNVEQPEADVNYYWPEETYFVTDETVEALPTDNIWDELQITTNYFQKTEDGSYVLTVDSHDEGKVDDVVREEQVVKEAYYSIEGTIQLDAAADWSQARILVSSDANNEYIVALERTGENAYQVFTMSKNNEELWNDWQLIIPSSTNGANNSIDFEVVANGNEMYFLIDDAIYYSNDRVEAMEESTVKFSSCATSADVSDKTTTTTITNLRGQVFDTQSDVERYLTTKNERPYDVSSFETQINELYQEYIVDNNCAGKGGTLLLGHSHFDEQFWTAWEEQTGLMRYVDGYNVGIGGTATMDWLYAYDKLVKPFDADRFVISLGENDINGWQHNGDVIAKRLEKLFAKIHEDHPDSEIYYIYTLPAAIKYVDGQWLNPKFEELINAEKALCESLDYVQGIDTFHLFVDEETKNVKTELYLPNNDIHLNADGFKVWSDFMYDKIFKGETFGVTVGDGVTYKTTNGIGIMSDEGDDATINMFGGSPRYAYLNDTFTDKFYFETEVNVSEVINNDAWPKFGLLLNGKTEMVKFYVDMTPEMTATTVGVVHQLTGQDDDWANAVTANVDNMKFTGSDKIKLAVARDGMDYYFYVNDELVLWEKCALEEEKSAVGMFSFNTVLTASDYTILKDDAAATQIEQAKEDVHNKVKTSLTTDYFMEQSEGSGIFTMTNDEGVENKQDSVTYNGSVMKASNYSVKGTISLNTSIDWAQTRIYINADTAQEHLIYLEKTNDNKYKTWATSNTGSGWNFPFTPIESRNIDKDTYSLDFEVIVVGNKIYFLIEDTICYVSSDVAMTESTVKFSGVNGATTTIKNLDGYIFKNAENAEKYVAQYEYAFKTTLDNLAPLQGTWRLTANGLYSDGQYDNFCVSQTKAADFVYEADITFNKAEWTSGLVFRAKDNPAEGSYVANVDRTNGYVRLFRFPDGTTVGEAFTGIVKDTYNMRVEAIGNSIKVYLDDALVIDTVDDTYSSGKLGLLTFHTSTTYQNVMYKEFGFRLTENYFTETGNGVYTLEDNGNTYYTLDTVKYEGSEMRAANYSLKGTITLNPTVDWAQSRIYISDSSTNEHLIYMERTNDGQYRILGTANLNTGTPDCWNAPFVLIQSLPVEADTYSVNFEIITIGNEVYFLIDNEVCYVSSQIDMEESSVKFSGVSGSITTVHDLDGQIFENAKAAEEYLAQYDYGFKTNLENLTGMQGTWTKTPIGLYSNGVYDNFALSETIASDFVYETDITFGQAQGAASVVFRSTDNPSQGSYVANIDRGTGQVRLFRFPGGIDVGTAYTEIKDTYHLRVEAIGNSLKCYVDGELMVAGTDDVYTSGKLGLLTFNTTVTYQDVMYKEVTIDDIPTLNDLEVSGTNLTFAPEYDKSVAKYEVDMPSDTSEMNVLATADEGTSITYVLKSANGVIYDNGTLTSGENKVLTPAYGASQMIINMTKDDDMSSIVLVITNEADAEYMSIEEYRSQLHFTPENNWLNDPNGLVYDTSNGTWHMFYQYLPQITNGLAKIWGHAVSDDLVNWVELPVAIDVDEFGAIWSGSCAVDENNTSGFFTDNKEGESKLVAMYTYCNDPFMQGVAYSKDHGVTWVKHRDANGLPAISTDYGEAGLRDPKIFKVPGDEKDLWYMVVAGGRGRIFVSENLREWTLIQEMTYADGSELHSECPDLYPLEVLDKDGNGTGTTKWVYAAASKFYVIGDMVKGDDGYYRFQAEVRIEASIAAGNMNAYATAYAAQSFYNDPVSGRRISVHWLWDETAPNVISTKRWNGILSLPLETTLKQTDSGYMIVQNPVDEVELLRADALLTKSNVTVEEDSENILKGITGQIYEIEAIFSNFAEASEFGFELRTGNGQKTIYKYDVQNKKVILDKTLSGIWDNDISSWSLEPRSDGTVKLRVIVDKGAIETFGNDGDAHLVDLLFADESSVGMSFYTKGGSVTIDELTVYDMKSIYTQESVTKYVEETYISLQAKENVEAGTEFTVSAGIYPMTEATLSGWSIPEGLEVVSETENSVTLKGTTAGSYTVSYTVNGKTAETTINIFTERFSTNLTGWSAVSGNWAITDDGLKTSNLERWDDWYVSEVSVPSNKSWIYEADLNVTSVGAGGLVVGIKDPANVSAHWICLNTQPEANQFKLFKVGSDAWSEVVMPYANYPELTNPGKCHMRFEYDANSSTLTYKVAPHGTEDYVIVGTQYDASLAAYDGSFYFGLNTFWSETIFNNVKLQVLE